MALPLNFRVTAFIFALFDTRKFRLPRNIAVLPEEKSFCSNPCRNKTGSASDTDALMPLPEAIGFSSGSGVLLTVRPGPLLTTDRPTVSINEGRDIVLGTGLVIDGRTLGRMVSVNIILSPPSLAEYVEARDSDSEDRVEDAEDGVEE